MTVEIGYYARRRIEKPVFGFNIKTGNGFYVFGSNTQIAKVPVAAVEGTGQIRLRIEPLALKQGRFFLSLAVHSWDHTTQYHRQEDLYPFVIKDVSEDKGIFQLNCIWEHQPMP